MRVKSISSLLNKLEVETHGDEVPRNEDVFVAIVVGAAILIPPRKTYSRQGPSCESYAGNIKKNSQNAKDKFPGPFVVVLVDFDSGEPHPGNQEEIKIKIPRRSDYSE